MARPPQDVSLLRQAMLTGIAQRLKAGCDPPIDLIPELRNILRRLEEQKDNEKRRPIPQPWGDRGLTNRRRGRLPSYPASPEVTYRICRK